MTLQWLHTDQISDLAAPSHARSVVRAGTGLNAVSSACACKWSWPCSALSKNRTCLVKSNIAALLVHSAVQSCAVSFPGAVARLSWSTRSVPLVCYPTFANANHTHAETDLSLGRPYKHICHLQKAEASTHLRRKPSSARTPESTTVADTDQLIVRSGTLLSMKRTSCCARVQHPMCRLYNKESPADAAAESLQMD